MLYVATWKHPTPHSTYETEKIHPKQKSFRMSNFLSTESDSCGDGFISEFPLGGGLTGAGEEASACDRYHFRWIPPSDVNSHVVTDGSDLWPIY